MKILSTADIPIQRLSGSCDTLPSDWGVEVDQTQFNMRAMEVPSWVSFVANAPWWIQFLAASASVYVSGILSEAGKDTWRNRGRLVEKIRDASSAIAVFCELLIDAKAAGTDRTFLMVEIPVNEYQNVKLKLDFQTKNELEFEIALFVHFIPDLESLIQNEKFINDGFVGDIFIEFGQDDFSMLVSWMDKKNLEQHKELIRFSNHRQQAG